jgi:hypothetical protein
MPLLCYTVKHLFFSSFSGLEQWYSTWGTRTLGGTRRHLRGYVKFKKYIYIYIIL